MAAVEVVKMFEACAAGINDIIIGIVGDQLKAGLDAINQQKLFKELKDEVDKKIESLIGEMMGQYLLVRHFMNI